MSNPKGGRYERQLLDCLRGAGIGVVRVHDGGTRDEGDLRIVTIGGGHIAVQAKNYKNLADAINAGFRDLDEQVRNAQADIGCVAARRHGKPDPRDSVVAFRLGDLIDRRFVL